MVIFFLSLKAYYGQVLDPSDKTFAFLSLSWHGDPKKVRNDTRLLFGGSGAMGGLGWFLKYLRNHPRPPKAPDPP